MAVYCKVLTCKSKKIENKRIRAKFNFDGLPARYCNAHKLEGMINVDSRKCITCKTKQPCYNIPTNSKAEYCGDCKSDDMVNVSSKKCLTCNKKQPTFNEPGETLARYCFDCKTDTMIDLKTRMCIKCNKVHPSFNNPGEKTPLFCATCKTNDMIDVLSKKCMKCKIKQANFNNIGEQLALFCADCKEDDMINVKSKKCFNCKIRSGHYHNPGEENVFCRDCKTDDMTLIIALKCKSDGCDHFTQAGDFCAVHSGGLLNIYPDRACKHCCQIYVMPKYRFAPYCFRCYCVLNPDVEIPNQYKLKEHLLRDELKLTFPDVKMIFDKKIDGGCSLRRPDIRIECFTHTVIIENDENGDRHPSPCDDARNNQLYEDLGYRPIIMLRYNPDGYKTKIGIRKPSCFKYSDKVQKLQINDKKEWTRRISILVDKIKHHMNNIPDEMFTVERLFFNNYD